jgi:hypothetical protein
MEVEETVETRREEKKGLNWRKANVAGMREDLDGEDWNRIMRGMSVEEAWTHLKNKIQGAIDRHVPEFKSHRKPRPAWLSQETVTGQGKEESMENMETAQEGRK